MSTETRSTRRERNGRTRVSLKMLAALVLALAMVLAACSGGDGEVDPDDTDTQADSGSDDTGSEDGQDEESGTDDSASEVLTIGGIFSLTGAHAQYDEPLHSGLEMAVEEANANGGIEIDGSTYTIELVVEDAQSAPDAAVAGARKLVTNDGVNILIGNGTSGPGQAVAEYAIDERVLYFGVFTTLENLLGQEGADLLFRMWPAASETNKTYIPAAVEALGIDGDVAAVFPNEDVSNQVIEQGQEPFDSAGAPLVANQLFQPGTTDFAPIIQQAMESDPSALFIGYTEADMESLIRQSLTVRDAPLTFVTYGGSGAPGLNHQEEIDGYAWQIFTRAVQYGSPDPDVQDWAERYRDFTGQEELGSLADWALAFYDPFFALVEAMETTGTVTDVEAIADALHGMCYEGIRDVCWDDEGRASSNYDIGVIQDGELTIETVPVSTE